MMDERARTGRQYEVFQRRRRCWLEVGRTALTLSVLGLLTVGLYVGSNRLHLLSDGESAGPEAEHAQYVAVRERRDAPTNYLEQQQQQQHPTNHGRRRTSGGLRTGENRPLGPTQRPRVNPEQQSRQQQPQQKRPRKPNKSPKKHNAVPKTYGNESTDIIYIDAGPRRHHNLSDNGEFYHVEDNVLKHHPDGGTTIESVVHVRRYKCFKHPHRHPLEDGQFSLQPLPWSVYNVAARFARKGLGRDAASLACRWDTLAQTCQFESVAASASPIGFEP
uniref:Uncharacterized protein n=1 Tax=Anopheles atroparvus TaxID=41427 RepID=A0A182IMT3_ANOAO